MTGGQFKGAEWLLQHGNDQREAKVASVEGINGIENDGIIDTDLMSLINRAWTKRFARVDKNKNAISERGWNPLNKALILDPVLRSTMTAKEKADEYNRANQTIIPNKHKNIV